MVIHSPELILPALAFGAFAIGYFVSVLLLLRDLRLRLGSVSIWYWSVPFYLQALYLKNRARIGSTRMDRLAAVAVLALFGWVLSAGWAWVVLDRMESGQRSVSQLHLPTTVIDRGGAG